MLHLLTAANVKVFGRRPLTERATRTGAGVRKPARDETAGYTIGAVQQAQLWRFNEAVAAGIAVPGPQQGLGAVKQPG
jgi:hypothetical protein